jgi:hypothetical protein
MSCQNYETCIKQERENLKYPIDNQSLYMHRINDNQTANRRCYEKNPIEIVEGFGFGFTWNQIIKFVIVIVALLVVLFRMLAKDFFMPKEVVSFGIASPSEINFSPLPPMMTK